MIACYILFSPKLNKFYIGITQESSTIRLEKNNNGFYKDSYSKITDDWVVCHFIVCTSMAQSMKIEKHIKKMKSKIYIQNLIKYPEMAQKLIEKYK